jgi:hypothetical protein
MAEHYFIYTVTGGHEVFYAAVDRSTGRVWTAPTKEVAHRQARDAGLETFTERVISKDALLESLGIHNDRRAPVEPDRSPPREQDVSAASKTPWFVAGDGTTDSETAQSLPRLPSLRGKGKSARGAKGKSPFAASQPIGAAAPGGEGTDDMLIVPATDHASGPATPFTDAEAAKPEESGENYPFPKP